MLTSDPVPGGAELSLPARCVFASDHAGEEEGGSIRRQLGGKEFEAWRQQHGAVEFELGPVSAPETRGDGEKG